MVILETCYCYSFHSFISVPSVYLHCQSVKGDDYVCIVYLLFPVEAASVAVGDVDVTIGLEKGELEATQHGVEQLPARSLGRK